MLRIDERDDQNSEETVHRQAALAQIVERTVAAHTLEDESDEADSNPKCNTRGFSE